ncbi:MAG: alkyl sulfatase dimerization domain-containing protein [Polyangiaceae bacterium]
MADLLALSAKFIDEDLYDGPFSVNRVNTELSEIADGVAMVEAFSHVVAFGTDAGLVLFDTSLEPFAPAILRSLRGWSKAPVHTIAYTHGHVDHVGGAQAFIDETKDGGHPEPTVVGHEGVVGRFARYDVTNGYNGVINQRQFATLGGGMLGVSKEGRWGPSSWVAPGTTFADHMSLRVGDTDFELHHDRGETDDHLWAWVPEHKALVVGDFVTWVFPNAGNPQKVQRYPAEWAHALREMAALDAELMLPAHGLPVAGNARIKKVLRDLATVLEGIVVQTITLMNDGATLNDILHTVRPPEDLMKRPYLRPVYDEPEFVVRNVWRLYGGWYDGNPAHLKPSPDATLAAEVARLAGGAKALASRALELAERDPRLACELAEMAGRAAPDDAEIHASRAEVYGKRRDAELSLMAKGIYASAAAESERKAKGASS